MTPKPGKPGRGPAAISTPGKERHNTSLPFVSGTSGPELTPPTIITEYWYRLVYPVAFRRRKRGDAEDSGKEMRGAQRVMGKTNPLRAPKTDWVRV